MAITKIPGWHEHISDNVGKTPLEVYARVPLVYRCANLVANSASTTPFYLRHNQKDVEWLYRTPIEQLIKRMVLDLQLYGKSYVLKVIDVRGNVLNLKRLNPNRMTTNLIGVDKNGDPVFEHILSYSSAIDSKMRTYSHDEIIYCRFDGETQDVYPEVYPARVALGSAKVLNYLAVFGEEYFDNGAMPTTILSVMDGSSPDQITRFETWVKRRITGIKRAFGMIALSSEVKATHLNPPAKDLAIPELDELNRKRVLDAFGVPEGMVERSANYASAETHHRQFWDMTVKPVVFMVVDCLNEQLFTISDYVLHAEFEELSVYQVDEARRSAALSNMRIAGVSLEAAWYTLGYPDLPEDIPLIGAQTEPSAVQETDSSMIGDEAVDDTDNDVETVKGVATVPSLFTHLDAWRNKAHNRVRRGKTLQFDFESEYIPVSMKSAIQGVLSTTQGTHTNVDYVFDHAINLHKQHSFEGY